jgi:hypothetical protein
VHVALAVAAESRAGRDAEAVDRHERDAREAEQRALAAEQQVEAARHRVTAEDLRDEQAALAPAGAAAGGRDGRDDRARARDERIRERAARRRRRERKGLRRLRPGLGSSFYSPAMVGTAGTASRHAAAAAEALDREIEDIGRALEAHGPTDRGSLRTLLSARGWGPGRFRAALREALEEGRIHRVSRRRYGPGRHA